MTQPRPYVAVAANIRAEVARHRLTHLQLAELLDLSQASVSRKLGGHVPFSIDEVAAIAGLLNMPVQALYAEQAVA